MLRPAGHWLVHRLLDSCYPVVEGYYRTRARHSRLREHRAVLVYQMGKVGSSTVTASLRAARLGVPVYSVHTLTDEGIATLDAFYRSTGFPYLPGGAHLLVSRFLCSQLRRGVSDGKWKVVTLVRDPVARNMSLLFQLGRRLLPDFEERCRDDALDVAQLTTRLENKYPGQVDCLSWFETELRRVFAVDVLSSPFPKDAGFRIYRGDHVDVLLLKVEYLDTCGADAMEAFLGVRGLRLVEANVSRRKHYAASYQRFLQTVRVQAGYVARLYSSAYMRHLYSEEAIAHFRNRWLGHAPGRDG